MNELDSPGVGFIVRKPEGIAIYKAAEPFAWVCLLCERLSHNPNDVTHEWCGCCGSRDLPRLCEHRTAHA